MATQESTLRLGVDSRPMVQGLKKGDAALDRTGDKAKTLGGTFNRLIRNTGALKAAFAGLLSLSLGAFFASAINQSAKFETKMAEISTLVDTTSFKLDKLTDSIESASIAFGSDATVQAAAAYQIVSAGASSAAEATDILTASNKLAVGGVTDVATAADGLTSVLNAYGFAADQAGSVSDTLFIGVKQGKTTVNELAATLGKVAPLAAQTGVSFDELVSSVAALTKGGIQTTEAVTGVRAILAAVAKPSKEAGDLAAQLGIDFSAAGLEANGFAGFLEEVTRKTGGSTEAMAQLFGGVEALVPILALSGQAGVDFAATMDLMESKAGATDEAFQKMTDTFEFQSARVRQGINAALRELGDVITTALTPALKFLADNFGSIITFTKTFAVLLSAALLPSLVKLIPVMAGLTTKIVLMGAAFVATPFGAVIAAITAISAALTFLGGKTVEIGGTTATVWQVITAAVQTAIQIYQALRDIVVEAFGRAGQAVSEFFNINTEGLSGFFGNWRDVLTAVGNLVKGVINFQIGLWVGFIKSVGTIVTQGIPAAFNLAMASAKNITIQALSFIIEKFAFAIGSIAETIGMLPGVSDDLGINTYNSINSLGTGLQDLKTDTAELEAQFKSTGATIGETFGQATSTDYVGAFANGIATVAAPAVDMFNNNLKELTQTQEQAAETAKTLTDPVVTDLGNQFDQLGEKASGAKGKTKELNDELERPVTIQQGLMDAWKNISESIKTEGEIVSSALTDIFDGVGDAIVEFAKTGKLNFRDLAASVAQSVLKMTTQLLLFKAISALFPGLGGVIGAATGGMVTHDGLVKKFAAGGFVSGKGGPRDDKVPAMLSNGEFVVNAAATRQFGGLLQQINNGNMKDVRMLAAGGLAAANNNTSLAPAQATGTDGGSGAGNQPAQINVVSTISDNDVADAVNTTYGEKVILNMLSRNKNKLQGIVNG